MARRHALAILICTALILPGCTVPLIGGEEEVEPAVNEVPQLHTEEVDNADYGDAVWVRGQVTDEDPSSTLVTIAFSIPWGNIHERPSANGNFEYGMNGLEPGNYSVTISVKDDIDQTSDIQTYNFTIHPPVENPPILSVWRSEVWFEEGEEVVVGGEVEHLFLNSCSFDYSTENSLAISDLNPQYDSESGMFSLTFPPMYDSESGLLVVDCGRYTPSTASQALSLVMIEEEAPDADGDGIPDDSDSCPDGDSFVSSETTDHDSDGCYDLSEDTDDDNDGIIDFYDNCKKGMLGWQSNSTLDYDGDGCADASEDDDDDGDTINDGDDLCPQSPVDWDSTFSSDYDRDGCRDIDEDYDDDNDGVLDAVDRCPTGVIGWVPNELNDWDEDGCRDSDEDSDDDNDEVVDGNDTCPETEQGYPVNEQGCAAYEWDDDGDGVMDDVDTCQNTPAGYPVNEQGCADIDGDGVFANVDTCPNSQPRWTADANGCTVTQIPIGWSQGPYTTNPFGTVGPMDVETTTGTWRIENAWDGKSTYLFIFNYKSSSYMSSLWNQDVGQLLANMPEETTVFFGSYDSDYSTDISGMKNRVDNWLSSQPQEVQDSWVDRVHYVNERGWDTGGSLNAVINDWSAFYYGIDRFQRWRQIGSLFDWSQGTSCCYRLDYIANEPMMWQKEFTTQMRGSDPSITTVNISLGERHSGGWGGGYTTTLGGVFPNATEMAGFNTMEVYLEHSCSEHRDRYGIDDDGDGQPDRHGGCHEWDYLHYLKICDEDNASNCGTEFVRYITTYGREGRWLTDISPMLWMVKNGGSRNFTYQGANGGWLNLSVYLSSWDDDGLRPVHGEVAFTGGKFNSNYNNESQYSRRYNVNSSTQWDKVELAAIVTGHGFGNDPNNCAEFCNHEHRFSMNGNDVTHDFPMAGNSSVSSDQQGCKKMTDDGVVANQFGSWPYGRAGWCPGQDVPPWLFDITSWVNWGGGNEMLYQGLWNGQQYTETSNNPNIRALVWVIYYENTSTGGFTMVAEEIPENQDDADASVQVVTDSVGSEVESARIMATLDD